MRGQPGFRDIEERYGRLGEDGDALEKLTRSRRGRFSASLC